MTHQPVMLKEAVDGLNIRPGGRYVDGTFGRGGHSREIVRRGGEVLGIDRDEAAVAASGDVRVVRGNHGDLAKIAREEGWNEVDGVLLDLGVSSPQLDVAERGFSFQHDGPLDMRMDQRATLTAATIVSEWPEEDLTRVLRDFGEEPKARQIARAIVRARATHPFARTTQLAEFIESLIGRHGGHHPATRAFQALRMAVNDEKGELERALCGGMEVLKVGGRFAVITFESVTDRIVKRFFAAHVGAMKSLQQGGEEWVGVLPKARAVTRKAIVASDEEVERNPRSRSAKLRIVERA